jgi:hypothetical protein
MEIDVQAADTPMIGVDAVVGDVGGGVDRPTTAQPPKQEQGEVRHAQVQFAHLSYPPRAPFPPLAIIHGANHQGMQHMHSSHRSGDPRRRRHTLFSLFFLFLHTSIA